MPCPKNVARVFFYIKSCLINYPKKTILDIGVN